jgi:hypothetical protein
VSYFPEALMKTTLILGTGLGTGALLLTPVGHAQRSVPLKPDLVCTAMAFEGPNAIANGSTVSYPNFFVKLQGSNKGFSKSDQVTAGVEVFKNGTHLAGPLGTYGVKTLAAGESKLLVQTGASVGWSAKGNYQIVIKGTMDGLNQVAETNETNNVCWLTFTVALK